MPRPGIVQHFGRGDLVIGPDEAAAQRLATLWKRAGIACRATDNIQGELWSKLLMNSALNAMSALGHAHYGRIMALPAAAASIEAIVAEVMAVARTAGIRIPSIEDASEAMAAVSDLVAQMPEQHSSMAQDLARGRMTEIDALNGYICRLGAALGVLTPVNQALFALIKLIQSRRMDNP
jgi:2-dehydropantoate 2-reductase